MPHLLIVDDDDDILSLLTNFFKKHSHTVTSAADGAAMFAALETGHVAADRAWIPPSPSRRCHRSNRWLKA